MSDRDLDTHGAACRCLLRLRENEGGSYLSDQEFIARFLPDFPAWAERPGELDDAGLLFVAKAFGLADEIETTRDYGRVLAAHREGLGVLVRMERAPVQTVSADSSRPHVALLVAMNEGSFTLWCPFASGHSDVLPEAGRAWWDEWRASGLVLRRRGATGGGRV